MAAAGTQAEAAAKRAVVKPGAHASKAKVGNGRPVSVAAVATPSRGGRSREGGTGAHGVPSRVPARSHEGSRGRSREGGAGAQGVPPRVPARSREGNKGPTSALEEELDAEARRTARLTALPPPPAASAAPSAPSGAGQRLSAADISAADIWTGRPSGCQAHRDAFFQAKVAELTGRQDADLRAIAGNHLVETTEELVVAAAKAVVAQERAQRKEVEAQRARAFKNFFKNDTGNLSDAQSEPGSLPARRPGALPAGQKSSAWSTTRSARAQPRSSPEDEQPRPDGAQLLPQRSFSVALAEADGPAAPMLSSGDGLSDDAPEGAGGAPPAWLPEAAADAPPNLLAESLRGLRKEVLWEARLARLGSTGVECTKVARNLHCYRRVFWITRDGFVKTTGRNTSTISADEITGVFRGNCSAEFRTLLASPGLSGSLVRASVDSELCCVVSLRDRDVSLFFDAAVDREDFVETLALVVGDDARRRAAERSSVAVAQA